MIEKVQERSGSSRQRGFWLRCFLGIAMWGFLISIGFLEVPAKAQIEVVTIHLAKVHGTVTDIAGKPVANAHVTLRPVTEGLMIRDAETNSSGKFEFEHCRGSYWVQVKANGFSEASRHLIVGQSLQALFSKSRLYVMLGPQSCMDNCSPVYTSEKQFDNAVRGNTGRNKN